MRFDRLLGWERSNAKGIHQADACTLRPDDQVENWQAHAPLSALEIQSASVTCRRKLAIVTRKGGKLEDTKDNTTPIELRDVTLDCVELRRVCLN